MEQLHPMSDLSTQGAEGPRTRAGLLPALRLIASVVGVVVIVAVLAGALAVLGGWRRSLNPFGDKATD